MDTKEALIKTAIELLCGEGLEGFSTRAVCSKVGVKSPTLYHHFGSLDGLLDQSLSVLLSKFLSEKESQPHTEDVVGDLERGWDHALDFTLRYPKCYAAFLNRMLMGVKFSALERSDKLLMTRIQRAEKHLLVDKATAFALLWSSVHAASLLHLPLSPGVGEKCGVTELREAVMSRLFGATLDSR